MNMKIISRLIAITIIGFFNFEGYGQYDWKSVNLQGMGFVTGINIHPTQPNVVYARTDVGGTYKWDQANDAWIAVTDGQVDYGNEGTALDVNHQDWVYILVSSNKSELYKSTDGGTNWVKNSTFPSIYSNANGNYRWSNNKLVVDQNNDGRNIYFASRKNGLIKSNDWGVTWIILTANLPTGDNEASFFWGQSFVAIDKSSGNSTTNSQTLYVGVQGYGVYKSTDEGMNWSLLPGGPAVTNKPVSVAISIYGKLHVTYSTTDDEYANGKHHDIFICIKL